MRSSFALEILNLIATIAGIIVSVLVHLTIFIIKQSFYFFVGCGKVLFSNVNTKMTAIVLILVAVLDVSVAYRFTYQYRYSPCLHLLVILSPFFYLANVGKRPILEKEVYADDK